MMKIALYDYVPQRFRMSFEQFILNRMILDFKDGRNYATRWAARQMASSLRACDMRNVIIVCIPASCPYTNARRWKRFLYELCRRCHAINGFDLVKVHSCREKKHLSQDRCYISCMGNASIDASIKGQKVLVIDDICTTCESANEFIASLQAAGADVVMALFLAKTRKMWA